MATVRQLEVADLVWDTGAPLPFILATERTALFSFLTVDDEVRIAEFEGCWSIQFGRPNDETQHGHPVWGHGISHYGINLVEHSPWLEQLRHADAVHPQADDQALSNLHHFVLTFHDSTLEAVARGIRVVETASFQAEAIVRMMTLAQPLD